MRIRESVQKRYKNVTVIINNPCLEFWFLLHFVKTSKKFSNCCEVINKLKKNYLTDYNKSEKYYTIYNQDIYLLLKPYLNKAIAYSRSLGEFNPKNNTESKSKSEMFKLFKEIDKVNNNAY